MSAKAIYSNRSLNIYVHHDAFLDLMNGKSLSMPLYVGKKLLCYHGVHLELTIEGLGYLSYVQAVEQDEIARMQGEIDRPEAKGV